MVHKTKSKRGIRNSPNNDAANRRGRSGRLANGPATPVPNAPPLAHLSPTKLREAISDIWSQEVKADVPIPPVDNGSADNELSTTKEGTPPLSTTEEGTVIHEPLGGGPALPPIEAPPAAIEEARLAGGIAEAPLAEDTDAPVPVEVPPLVAPAPLKPNTGGEPADVFPVNDPAPPVPAHNNQIREQAIWD
ncbi:hypothetical protein PCANC_16123 [Puccinia coronata f. sp. avenae]|uniref:Uncharacterized protein n=1 Tax=Puccinia coronata f. sp. avenae TaxID=200324 RepID=A0A2N5SRV9_9BASI|nr:hypothetical protein PCANC_16123 [Puccinia coronata f. sp. avenae]